MVKVWYSSVKNRMKSNIENINNWGVILKLWWDKRQFISTSEKYERFSDYIVLVWYQTYQRDKRLIFLCLIVIKKQKNEENEVVAKKWSIWGRLRTQLKAGGNKSNEKYLIDLSSQDLEILSDINIITW